MVFSNYLQIIAVFLEVAVTVVAILIATIKKKKYGGCIAVTFGLFVLFDLVRIFSLPLTDEVHALIFLIACSSMLYGAGLMYRE